ncbi:MAG: general secretion pathway protein GspB [Gammaproteobacteria bacterium]
MSYILQALERSERQRQQRAPPNFNAGQSFVSAPIAARRPLFGPAALAVALLALAVAVYSAVHRPLRSSEGLTAETPSTTATTGTAQPPMRSKGAGEARLAPAAPINQPLNATARLSDGTPSGGAQPTVSRPRAGPDTEPVTVAPVVDASTADSAPESTPGTASGIEHEPDERGGAATSGVTTAPRPLQEKPDRPPPPAERPVEQEPRSGRVESAAITPSAPAKRKRKPARASGAVAVTSPRATATNPVTPKPAGISTDGHRESDIALVTPPAVVPARPPAANTVSARPGAPPAAPPSPYDSVPALASLPNDFRKALPALAINAHMYSETPSDRRVILNMQGYGEGHQLDSGVRVLAITRDGAVLSYQGQRFHLPR